MVRSCGLGSRGSERRIVLVMMEATRFNSRKIDGRLS
jgi:hypothetical protein